MSLEDAPAMSARLDIRDIALSRRSTPPVQLAIVDVRPLTQEKLQAILGFYPTAPDPKAPLARISAPHHMLARLIAQGKPVHEVSAITGYSTVRIASLKVDPSFAELVTYYEEEHVMAEADVSAQIRHIALTAGQIIQERLEDSPDEFSTKELQAVLALGLDRIGHGPNSRVDVRVTDTNQLIQQVRDQIKSESTGRVLSRSEVEAEYTEVTDEPPPQSE